MASLNKVQLIGRVGGNPSINTTQSGSRIANFSMAMTESWKDKSSGEKREKTEWMKVVCFNDGLTGVIEKYVKKGDLVYVEGALQTRKWNKDGVDHYTTEVVLTAFRGTLTMLASKKEGGSTGGGSKPDPQDPGYGDLDDDIPFVWVSALVSLGLTLTSMVA